MTKNDIKRLTNGLSKEQGDDVSFIETHISWVILTAKFAYKIKKPIKYPFLDYTTLEKRRFNCLKELVLNRRVTKDIYLAVVPIYCNSQKFQLTGPTGKIVEYAVKMKRLDENKLMIHMLAENKVSKNQIHTLAQKIAAFHLRCDVIQNTVDWRDLDQKFADINTVKHYVEKNLGVDLEKMIVNGTHKSTSFLQKHKDHINERVINGFHRDVHGDLHAKNIFLYDDPIIFDCIEFSDEYRQMDVLNEVAFCCMDLEANQRNDLSQYFLENYLKGFNTIRNPDDLDLFIYFKAYRANIRSKVYALRAQQINDKTALIENLNQIEKYLRLMSSYLEKI